MKKSKKSLGIVIINYILYSIVIVLGFLILASKLPYSGGLKVFTVMSGSMAPAIKTGSLVIDYVPKNYLTNDIITFYNPLNPRQTITHRLVGIFFSQGKIYYGTRGDNNDISDREPLEKNQILGKVILQIPYLGYIVTFTKTWPGLILLIIIPALIIIFEETVKIRKEVALWQKKRLQNKKIKPSIFRQIIMLLLMAGFLSLVSFPTYAHFKNEKK